MINCVMLDKESNNQFEKAYTPKQLIDILRKNYFGSCNLDIIAYTMDYPDNEFCNIVMCDIEYWLHRTRTKTLYKKKGGKNH